DLLHPRVNLLKLRFRRIGGGNDLWQGFLDGFAFREKELHLVVPAQAHLLPKILGIANKSWFGIDEIDLISHGVFGRHVIFRLKRRYVSRFQTNGVAVPGRDAAAFRKAVGPRRLKGKDLGVPFERKSGEFGKEVLTQNPMGAEGRAKSMIGGVAILDDAAGLYIGKREGLSQILKPASFYNLLFDHAAVKINDRAVRMDGSRLDVVNLSCSGEEGDLYV